MQIIAKSYRVSATAAGRYVLQTCKALHKILEPLYLPDMTTARWREIGTDFENLWQFPNCIGAIDGKHVHIEAPGNSGGLFRTYKGRFASLLLAVCDARYRFILVDVGEAGSRGDAGCFRECGFGIQFRNGMLHIPGPKRLRGSTWEAPHVVVGDEAFPLLENLMRPYPGKQLNAERRIFNYRLSRARRIIENSFGILANRWRILRQEMKGKLELLDEIIWSTVLLHNYLRTLDIEENQPQFMYCASDDVDTVLADGSIVPGRWRREQEAGDNFSSIPRLASNNYSSSAKAVREKFTRYFQTRHGRVPWQDRVLAPDL